MKPTAEIEAKGLKAYEQALAFERLRTWRLQVALTIFPLIPLLVGAWLWHQGHEGWAWANFIATALLAYKGRCQWRFLAAQYADNRRLLRELESDYGDQLSWVQVENHFAALEEIKREVAGERTDFDRKT